MSLMAFTLVGLGGAFGTVLRYAVSRWTARQGIRGIYSTLAVNLAGSFALGALIGLGIQGSDTELEWFLAAGFLGGMTTYSTLNVQKATLAAEGTRRLLAVYLTATYGGGLILTFAGYWLGRALIAT